MRIRISGMLATLALALPLVAIGGSATAEPGMSTTSVTVTPGGPFTAIGGPFVIQFDSGSSISCQTWRMGGDFTAGALMLPPVELSNCSTNGMSVPMTFTVSQWPIHWVSYSSAIDTAFGQVTSVVMRVSGSFCSFTLSGSSEFSYSNQTARLNFGGQLGPGTLRASNVSGCFGVVRSGDQAKFGYGSLEVSPPQVVRPGAA